MNSCQPLISVIIPIYNAEDTLKRCVDSVLAQDFEYYELILVDDGSKDRSSKLCDEYASHHKVIVIHQENKGVSAARNAGLNIARGIWITFVDSDDYISDGYFENVRESSEDLLLRGYMHYHNGKVFCPVNIPYEGLVPNTEEYVRKHLNSMIFRGPTWKFFRKALLEDIRFQEDMKVAEDSCFVMQYLAKVTLLKILPSAYYILCYHDEKAEDRYQVPIDIAATSLVHLLDAHKKLCSHIKLDTSSFYGFLSFFKTASRKDWEGRSKRWYNHPQIKRTYRYIWPDLPFKQKLQLLAIRIKDIINL